jgi:2-deoxy-D-gluconate 3-dehydrogenase
MPIPQEWSLSGRVAVLTTGRPGWSAVLAEGLAEAGADVALVGSSQTDLDGAAKAAEKYGKRVMTLVADVTRQASVRSAFRKVARALGSIDILVNNSQVEFAKPALDVTPAEYDRVMDQNVKAVFLTCTEAARYMTEQERGRIVNIASIMAERGQWNQVVYSASMGAVQSLTRSFDLEWARKGIVVNGIGTGWFTAEDIPLEKQREQLLVRYLPSRRLGHPRDIVPLMVYLCSDACVYSSGQVIYVDGGALAHA